MRNGIQQFLRERRRDMRIAHSASNYDESIGADMRQKVVGGCGILQTSREFVKQTIRRGMTIGRVQRAKAKHVEKQHGHSMPHAASTLQELQQRRPVRQTGNEVMVRQEKRLLH